MARSDQKLMWSNSKATRRSLRARLKELHYSLTASHMEKYGPIVEVMKLRESKGGIFDHLYLDEKTKKALDAFEKYEWAVNAVTLALAA